MESHRVRGLVLKVSLRVKCTLNAYVDMFSLTNDQKLLPQAKTAQVTELYTVQESNN